MYWEGGGGWWCIGRVVEGGGVLGGWWRVVVYLETVSLTQAVPPDAQIWLAGYHGLNGQMSKGTCSTTPPGHKNLWTGSPVCVCVCVRVCACVCVCVCVHVIYV